VHGEYAAGSRLPTTEALSESLGVSRSVVRDALRTLSSMGLVEVRHGHGIFVAVPRDDILTSALTCGCSDKRSPSARSWRHGSRWSRPSPPRPRGWATA
jgi:DNA-binding FadR family transcriptional regulator